MLNVLYKNFFDQVLIMFKEHKYVTSAIYLICVFAMKKYERRIKHYERIKLTIE